MHLLRRRCSGISGIPRVVITAVVLLPTASALTLISYAALYSLAPDAVWSAQLLSTITLQGVIACTLPEMYFLLASWAALYG